MHPHFLLWLGGRLPPWDSWRDGGRCPSGLLGPLPCCCTLSEACLVQGPSWGSVPHHRAGSAQTRSPQGLAPTASPRAWGWASAIPHSGCTCYMPGAVPGGRTVVCRTRQKPCPCGAWHSFRPVHGGGPLEGWSSHPCAVDREPGWRLGREAKPWASSPCPQGAGLAPPALVTSGGAVGWPRACVCTQSEPALAGGRQSGQVLGPAAPL